MATFRYVAKDQNAKTLNGKIVAESQAAVVDELRKRKLIIISVAEVRESSFKGMSFGGKRVKEDDLVIFARQLSTLVDSGVPLLQGLDALEEQITHPYFKSVIGNVKDDIEVGSSLSGALAKHPNVFDVLFVNMVRAGEAGGMLSAILDRVASYKEKSLKLKRKVKAAMVYPIVVIFMAMAITLFLLVTVVPTFSAIFESLGTDLPLPTQILLAVSGGLRKWFLLYAVAGVALGFGFVLYKQTDAGEVRIDKIKLKLPVVGELIRKVAVSRFSRTLATLTQSGVPILASLDIVGKTCGNRVLEIAVNNVKNNVREGESIAPTLAKSGVFPVMVTRMISVGEKTGEMEKMLSKIADFYDDQVDAAVAGLTSVIEPVIIGFLGVVVGGIVISLFMPILTIVTKIK
ncbi:MAG TPA: type II secretion system F family protein [Candidatus Omnitrophota bacterium]|nr:type II secretion system F family protein [Candidatus Omnitrophota bacterium]HPD84008.1 type II secretion system F family protein [Candidatus Omnitrophota bacterium]HRZ02865.1 type II secretion system F family protein [Candidatus Omnitrophota bacterium]